MRAGHQPSGGGDNSGRTGSTASGDDPASATTQTPVASPVMAVAACVADVPSITVTNPRSGAITFAWGNTERGIRPNDTVSLDWPVFVGGDEQAYLPEVQWSAFDNATDDEIANGTLLLTDACAPVSPVVARPGCGGDIGGVFSPETLYITIGRDHPASGWTINRDGVFYSTWEDALAFETVDDAAITWPSDDDPNALDPIWHESFVVDVLDAAGSVIYHDTFSEARLAEEGATGCLRLFEVNGPA
jgi:hypothetical protein